MNFLIHTLVLSTLNPDLCFPLGNTFSGFNLTDVSQDLKKVKTKTVQAGSMVHAECWEEKIIAIVSRFYLNLKQIFDTVFFSWKLLMHHVHCLSIYIA